MTAEDINLWKTAKELTDWFPEGLVYIGGLAVSEHVVAAARKDLHGEYTHDGDFCLSIHDYGDLRDMEELYPNRRLSKHQLLKNGHEFDVYVQYQNSLPVPFEELAAYSEKPGALRIAAPEHLVVMKSLAALDRGHSAKGRKDKRDIAKVIITMQEPRPEIIEHLMTEEMREAITDIGLDTCLELAEGNAQKAQVFYSELKIKRTRLLAASPKQTQSQNACTPTSQSPRR